jgi:hypothetical protein
MNGVKSKACLTDLFADSALNSQEFLKGNEESSWFYLFRNTL